MNEKKSNLLFIIPGFFYIEDYQKLLYYNDIPLGTLQISSFLKKKARIETDIVDLRVESEINKDLEINAPNNDRFKENFLKLLERNNVQDYDNIGINCFTSFQYLYTDYISKILKEEFPNIGLIVGGYHPSAVPRDFNYNGAPYDFIIQGEAELPLIELFKSSKLKCRNSPSNPQILSAKTTIDVDKLPFPDYDLYLRKYPFKDKFKFEIYNSRGCPYQCAFCAKNYCFRSFSFKHFKKNFLRLCKLIEDYSSKSPKIGFTDQSFNTIAISEKILDYILKNEFNEKLTFSCQSRIESIAESPGIINKLKKCKMVVGYGFETANKDLLIEMHKTNKPTDYLENTIKILEKYNESNGTYCRLNVLVGFPGENKRTFDDSVDFIEKYALHENVQISPTLFENYPNAFVYNNMDYYENKFGTKFIKEWWKLPSNPLKNSIPLQSSKDYSLKEVLVDYVEKYTKILNVFKKQSFLELITWKKFYNKWIKQL